MTETKKEQGLHPVRNYKARMFEMIFREKKELLNLYNAVNHTQYTNPEDLDINTLENAVYLSMKNDVSFVIGSRLSLFEQQSTYNPNLPLRYLFYISDLYSSMIRLENLYGTRLVKIPTPRFIIFYNGGAKKPEKEVLKLSEAFLVKEKHPMLELKAEFININPGYNEDILSACKTLKDYSEYTVRVRKYIEDGMEIASAVERAVTECIYEGILEDFLRKNRAEAIKMSIYEYDEERQRMLDREEGREIGLEEGREIEKKELILKNHALGMSDENIAAFVFLSVDMVRQIIKEEAFGDIY